MTTLASGAAALIDASALLARHGSADLAAVKMGIGAAAVRDLGASFTGHADELLEYAGHLTSGRDLATRSIGLSMDSAGWLMRRMTYTGGTLELGAHTLSNLPHGASELVRGAESIVRGGLTSATDDLLLRGSAHVRALGGPLFARFADDIVAALGRGSAGVAVREAMDGASSILARSYYEAPVMGWLTRP